MRPISDYAYYVKVYDPITFETEILLSLEELAEYVDENYEEHSNKFVDVIPFTVEH